MKSKGKIIEDLDILIASIAIADNCILVTNNTDHFERASGWVADRKLAGK